MTWLEFVASVIRSVAWPAAVFGAVFVFRENIARLLPLARLKRGEWEFSFRLDRAEEEAAALPAGAEEAVPPTPEEQDRFEQLIHTSPRAAVLEKRAELESAVRSYAGSLNIPRAASKPFGLLVRDLRKAEMISPTTSGLLDDLRSVGNVAAHSNADMSSEEARRYGELADKAIQQVAFLQGAAGHAGMPG